MTNVDRIVVFRDAADEWRWHAKAANGEIVAEGEAHTTPQDAERAARGVFSKDVPIVRDNGLAVPAPADPGDEQPEPIPGQLDIEEA